MVKGKELKYFISSTHHLKNFHCDFQAARRKFHAVESEASKSSEVLKETLEGIKGRMEHVIEEASKTDIAKKAGKNLYSSYCKCILCIHRTPECVLIKTDLCLGTMLLWDNYRNYTGNASRYNYSLDKTKVLQKEKVSYFTVIF